MDKMEMKDLKTNVSVAKTHLYHALRGGDERKKEMKLKCALMCVQRAAKLLNKIDKE